MIIGGILSPLRVLVEDVERRRPEARVALAGAAELAVDDRLDRVLLAVDRDDQDVLAGDLASGLDRGDGAERHLVVVRVDDGRVGMRLQQGLGDLAALVAGEVAGLAGEDDHIGRLGLDRVVEALLAVVGGRGADRALELDDLALAAGLLDRPVGDALAFEDEVRADEGEEVDAGLGERRIDVAVDQQHRNAGLLGVHDRRDQRLLLARRQEDEVDALSDHAVDVGDLLGGRAGGVGIDELAPRLAASSFMLAVCARRQGLLLSVWAKPTL